MNDHEITAGKHTTYWIESEGKPIGYEKLKKSIDTEVVIIGGGIAGLSVAYCLALRGTKVALVEDGYIGSGETGRTTAHLVNALDDRYFELERMYGEENAQLIAQSHTEAINFIETTVKKENIDCEFKRIDGYLFLHPSDKEDALQKEFAACKRAHIDVELTASTPGLLKQGQTSLVFKNQGQFHPLKYLRGLCEAILKKGGQIYTQTHAKEIDNTGIVTDEGYKITANHVVVATNTPINNRYIMHLKQGPYRTYAIGMLVEKTFPEALWWDTGDFNSSKDLPPYHYVRKASYDEKHDLLICGGEDHAVGMAHADVIPEENRYAMLEDWCNKHFATGKVVYRWSGQVMEPMDSLAYIGHNPLDKKNVYIVTGDSGNGMTHGTIAGILISDLINGNENKWMELYSPMRFKIFRAGGVFFREFMGGFMTYLKEKAHGEGEGKLAEIKTGEGTVVEIDGKKYGAYVDMNKQLHLVEAECTHLKCIVRWNNDEKSWDCPCHGSRFSYEGKVLNGPANIDLVYKLG